LTGASEIAARGPGGCDLAESNGSELVLGLREIRVVEYVESFCPELQANTFRDGRILRKRHVDVLQSGRSKANRLPLL
jgi:hypothetical protein